MTQKQCTESKTGLGAQMHTQLTLAARIVHSGCAHGAPKLGAVHSGRERTSCARPCRGHAPAGSQPVAGRVMAVSQR